jgi:hypothetical protein
MYNKANECKFAVRVGNNSEWEQKMEGYGPAASCFEHANKPQAPQKLNIPISFTRTLLHGTSYQSAAVLSSD